MTEHINIFNFYTMKKWHGVLMYLVAIALIITSFFIPPAGEIDPSVLTASGIIIFGWQFCFGTSIKEFTIDSNGVHITTHEKKY